MPENSPLVIESIPMDEDPHRVLQTGYDPIDYTVLRFPSHTDTTFVTHLATLPTAHAKYDDAAELVKAAGAITATWTADNDDNITLIAYLFNLSAQARTYIRSVAAGTVPVMLDDYEGGGLTFFREAMYNGLRNKQMPYLKNDGSTAATTLTEFINGLDWDDTGVGTNEHHMQWVRRFIYVLGLYWANQFPEFFHRLDQSSLTQITRTTYLFLCASIYIITDFFMIAAMQSDRAVFNLGFLEEGLINKKVDTDMATAIDIAWNQFIKENKYAYHNATNFKTFASSYIDTTLLDGTTLETSIREYKTKHIVLDLALKLARVMFGIGKYQDNGENVNFMILLDLCKTGTADLATTGFTSHGTTKWTIGANTRIAQLYFVDARNRNREWADAVDRMKHWTHTDIINWSKGLFVEFSMHSSLMGLIEPDAYRAIRTQVYESNAVFGAAGISNEPETRDPNGIDNAGAVVTGYTSCAPTGLIWPYLLLQRGQIKEEMRLYFPVHWSINQIIYHVRYGMLLNTVQSVKTHNYRFTPFRRRMIQCLETKTELIHSLATSGTGEVVRFENVKDILDTTNWPVVALKYSCSIEDVSPAPSWLLIEPRPFGIKGNTGCYVLRIGEPDNMRTLLRMVMGTSSPAGNRSADPTPATPDPPLETTAVVDGDDE